MNPFIVTFLVSIGILVMTLLVTFLVERGTMTGIPRPSLPLIISVAGYVLLLLLTKYGWPTLWTSWWGEESHAVFIITNAIFILYFIALYFAPNMSWPYVLVALALLTITINWIAYLIGEGHEWHKNQVSIDLVDKDTGAKTFIGAFDFYKDQPLHIEGTDLGNGQTEVAIYFKGSDNSKSIFKSFTMESRRFWFNFYLADAADLYFPSCREAGRWQDPRHMCKGGLFKDTKTQHCYGDIMIYAAKPDCD